MRVLVTGAGRYIGSVVTEQVVAQGHSVLGLDSLSNGHREAVHPAAKLVEGDLLDAELLRALLAKEPVDAVCHLTAEALIGVSNVDLGRSFRVNVCGGLNLQEVIVANRVTRLVFSSTAPRLRGSRPHADCGGGSFGARRQDHGEHSEEKDS